MTKREKSHLQYIKDCEAFLIREGWTKCDRPVAGWLSPKGGFHYEYPQDAAHVWSETLTSRLRRKMLIGD